jgi:glycerate kinase
MASKPVIAICGKCDLSSEETKSYGFRQVISLVDNEIGAESAIQHAAQIITTKIAGESKTLM